jgi:DNA-binding NarL/FixJ family response regulator
MQQINYAIFNESSNDALAFTRLMREINCFSENYFLNCRFKTSLPDELMQSLLHWQHSLEILIVPFPFSLPTSENIIAEVRNALTTIKILVITKTEDRNLLTKQIEDGANGIISSGSSCREIFDACVLLSKEPYLLNEYISSFVLHMLGKKKKSPPQKEYVPDETEIKIVQKIYDELLYKEIEEQLKLSAGKVHHVIEKIAPAINARGSKGVVKYFLKHHYIRDVDDAA